ncbi:MAG: hypothetical protein IKG58_03500 [Bacilli bacterium]|nr:hypothetical protein [Bacilli bacterium]MBR3049602.1 hypothetical protein [Bacilli bacterium]
MIEEKDYDEIIKISKDIETSAKVINDILKKNNIDDLNDFISTVEGYSKYLNTNIELNKDADVALKDLVPDKKRTSN